MGKVIGRLPVVYDPATRRLTVESAGEFVETQLHGQVHTGQLHLYHPRNEEHDRRDL